MGPPRDLVHCLKAMRCEGEAFDRVWAGALEQALAGVAPPEREEWREVLEGMRSTWREAYEGGAPARSQRAAAAILDPARVVPVPERECERCGAPAADRPAGNGGLPPRFCSELCRRLAREERRQLGLT